MSVSRLCKIPIISDSIKRAFLCADVYQSAEDILWRAVAARAVLDAVGYPGISDPEKWNKAVKEARLWFRYSDDNKTLQSVFAMAGINLKLVRIDILKVSVRYYDKMLGPDGFKYYKE